MRRTPIPILAFSGTPCEVAFALGKKRRRWIENRVLAWDQMLARLYRGRRDVLMRLEKSFFAQAKKQVPHYLDEIRAMAEGAAAPMADLFRLNCTELNAFVEKCTTLILPLATPGGPRVMIAHNEDWNPRRNDVFVLKVKLPTVSYVILTYDGYLPGLSCGFNSWGLYHAVNYLRPKDLCAGLPRIFITRHLVTATDFKDCLDWIHKSRRAFGQSIHLAQEGRYQGIEITAKKVIERQVQLPIAHANHYLSPQLKSVAAPASESSRLRQEVAEKILHKYKNKISFPCTAKQAKIIATHILSDRSKFPFCIWRDADAKGDESATVATAVMITEDSALSIYRHQPSDSQALQVKFF